MRITQTKRKPTRAATRETGRAEIESEVESEETGSGASETRDLAFSKDTRSSVTVVIHD